VIPAIGPATEVAREYVTNSDAIVLKLALGTSGTKPKIVRPELLALVALVTQLVLVTLRLHIVPEVVIIITIRAELPTAKLYATGATAVIMPATASSII
jgi:uncharacterized membrane protein YoaT (DUF817 family)